MTWHFLDWTAGVHADGERREPVSCRIRHSGELITKVDQLLKTVLDVANLNVSGDTPGASILRKWFDDGDGHNVAGIAMDRYGLIVVVLEDSKPLKDKFHQDQKMENIAHILVQLIRHAFNDDPFVRTGQTGSTYVIGGEERWPVAIEPISKGQSDTPSKNAVIIGGQVQTASEDDSNLERTARNLLRDGNVLQLRAASWGTRACEMLGGNALSVLGRRRLVVRDLLTRTLDLTRNRLVAPQRIVAVQTELAASISLMLGLFLGSLLAQTIFVISWLNDVKIFTGSSLGLSLLPIVTLFLVVVTYALWNGKTTKHRADTTLIPLGISLLAIAALWIAVRSNVDSWGMSVLEPLFALLTMGAIGLFLSTLASRWMKRSAESHDSSTKSRSQFTSLGMKALIVVAVSLLVSAILANEVANDPAFKEKLNDLVMTPTETGIFSVAMLLASAVLYWSFQMFEDRAQQLIDAMAQPQNIQSDIDRITLRREAYNRWLGGLRAILLLLPAVILAIATALYLLPLGGILDSIPAPDPDDMQVPDIKNRAVYTEKISQIAWALPVLSFGVLVSVWNRFGSSGALTVVHDSLIARMERLQSLIKLDGELTDRINNLHTGVPAGSPDRPKPALPPMPNMDRESEALTPKIALLDSLRTSIRNRFLRRTALVATGVIALLQIAPLKSLEPIVFPDSEMVENTNKTKDAEKARVQFYQAARNLLAKSGGEPIDVRPSFLVNLHVSKPQMPIQRTDINIVEILDIASLRSEIDTLQGLIQTIDNRGGPTSGGSGVNPDAREQLLSISKNLAKTSETLAETLDSVPSVVEAVTDKIETLQGTSETLSKDAAELGSSSSQLAAVLQELRESSDKLSDSAANLEKSSKDLSEGVVNLKTGSDNLSKVIKQIGGPGSSAPSPPTDEADPPNEGGDRETQLKDCDADPAGGGPACDFKTLTASLSTATSKLEVAVGDLGMIASRIEKSSVFCDPDDEDCRSFADIPPGCETMVAHFYFDLGAPSPDLSHRDLYSRDSKSLLCVKSIGRSIVYLTKAGEKARASDIPGDDLPDDCGGEAQDWSEMAFTEIIENAVKEGPFRDPNKTPSILLLGYADSIGRPGFNQSLSHKRADFVEQGVAKVASRLDVHVGSSGRGEELRSGRRSLPVNADSRRVTMHVCQ